MPNTDLKEAIATAEGLYYRLVLLVGKSGSGKTQILKNLAGELNTTIININLILSEKLLELSKKQRTLQIPSILSQITAKSTNPVILDNLEILFDKDIKQDPLRLLQGISRNQTVIATWNGEFDGNRLYYAELSHPEYRCYDNVDAQIVTINNTSAKKAQI
ncbi:MAG: BREX-3 system P-loop-containing protein BrxF [Fibrobacteria bacterium]|nr:BREX-3 system P-loop-containing protein BrxF [Fibrobacteria bacterium]